MNGQPTLLCVDDDPSSLRLYQVLLACHGYDVIAAENGWQALQLLLGKRSEIAAVILDYEMPAMRGDHLAAEIRRWYPELPIIMISGNLEIAEHVPLCVDAVVEKGTSWDKTFDQLDRLVTVARSKPAQSSLPSASQVASA